MPMIVDVAELDARFDRLLKSRPDLQGAAELQRALLREVYRASPRVNPPLLPRERARQKLAEGVPLLHGEPLDPDVAFCRDLFGRLLNVLQARPESAEVAAQLARVAADGRLELERALGEALAGHPEHLAELAAWAAVPPDALAASLALIVRPPLHAVAEAYRPLLQDVERWPHGYCPVCGAWPGLAELQMTEQQRHLRCLRCGADWGALRLQCAYCGNDDHESLGYLQGERELRYRVEVCERCKGYLKSINAFEPTPPAYLPLDDFASMHLDVAAVEHGYSRPETPGFRLELGEEEPDEALDDLLEAD